VITTIIRERGKEPIHIETLWCLEILFLCGRNILLVRANDADHAVELVMNEWNIPREKIVNIYEWGFNLTSYGIVFSFLLDEY